MGSVPHTTGATGRIKNEREDVRSTNGLLHKLDRSPVRPFEPIRPIRNGFVQTLLTITKTDIPAWLYRSGVPFLLDAGPDETGEDEDGVRLLGYYNPPAGGEIAKAAVVLLHGWEGCSHSSYNLVCAAQLMNAGYHVLRLNLRDHGPGYHVHPQSLNPGVFLGTLLSETVAAISRFAEMVEPLPLYVVGFSMGGNFAMRVAMRQSAMRIANLHKAVAVNPALNPFWSTLNIDRNPALRRYFRRPWLQQLRGKQRFFPERYDFGPLEDMASLIDMTTWLVRYLGRFADAEEYFYAYSVLGNATRNLAVPTLVITSFDDMVVPVADFYGLAPSPHLKIDVHSFGGHVGYMDGLPPQHQISSLVLEGLERHTQ